MCDQTFSVVDRRKLVGEEDVKVRSDCKVHLRTQYPCDTNVETRCTKRDAEKFLEKYIKGAPMNKVRSDALRLNLLAYYSQL